jgi:hypothetical protein
MSAPAQEGPNDRKMGEHFSANTASDALGYTGKKLAITAQQELSGHRTLRAAMHEPWRGCPLPRRTTAGRSLYVLCICPLAYLDIRYPHKNMAT